MLRAVTELFSIVPLLFFSSFLVSVLGALAWDGGLACRMEPAAIRRFWSFCARAGITSKRLSVRHQPATPCFPLSLGVEEEVVYGAPVISVPYLSVLNVETLRGDVVPRALPPFRSMRAFLTRRDRMDDTTAQSLWLAAFLATYARRVARTNSRGGDTASLFFAPLLCEALLPALPSPFTPATAAVSPAVGAHQPAALQRWERLTEEQVRLTRYVVAYRARRHGIASVLVPTDEEVLLAHRTVMQRSVLLPLNGEPSAPAELAELIEAAPGLPLLPSLVPAIDLIRPVCAATKGEAPSAKEPGEELRGGNCALYTCVHSDFVSSSSRRRVVLETAPLASRRVVVCATRNLKAGDELVMDYG